MRLLEAVPEPLEAIAEPFEDAIPETVEQQYQAKLSERVGELSCWLAIGRIDLDKHAILMNEYSKTLQDHMGLTNLSAAS